MTQQQPTTKRNAPTSPGLNLPPAPPVIPMDKLSASVPKAVLTDLMLYREAYREMNNAEISLDRLLEHVLVHHMRRDKSFITWAETTNRKLQSI
jgi:hypothetical protein